MLFRWTGICWDALVFLVMVAFGANVALRLRYIMHKDLWHITYQRNAILLDLAILALQAFSELLTATQLPICELALSFSC